MNQKKLHRICENFELTNLQLNQWNYIDSNNCHSYRGEVALELFNRKKECIGFHENCIIKKMGKPDKKEKGYFFYNLNCNGKIDYCLVFKHEKGTIRQIIITIAD